MSVQSTDKATNMTNDTLGSFIILMENRVNVGLESHGGLEVLERERILLVAGGGIAHICLCLLYV